MTNERLIKIISVFLIAIVGFFLLKPIFSPSEDQTKVVFFGLGKADSIYIENKGKNILIDTGLKSQKESLILSLEALRVKRIDYLILTHPDKDHIGSASYILERFEIGQLIQSNHIKDTKREARIKKLVDEKQIENIRPKEDLKFTVGDLNVTIFTPKKDYYEKDNDYSLITLIEDGELNYLFAGDAEKELLDETLEIDLPKIDLYKVPHHGRQNENSKAFIEKISPEYSVITNFETDGEIDDILKAANSKVMYVFGKNLTVFSDGKTLKFK